jgi:hypothetical protein
VEIAAQINAMSCGLALVKWALRISTKIEQIVGLLAKTALR